MVAAEILQLRIIKFIYLLISVKRKIKVFLEKKNYPETQISSGFFFLDTCLILIILNVFFIANIVV